jgi:regulator-associated protein of mTOR
MTECYTQERHQLPIDGSHLEKRVTKWLGRTVEKGRAYTMGVALICCLRIGVSPPDAVKSAQASEVECWIDPSSMAPSKALSAIGGRLQDQYERWQSRTHYRKGLDPTPSDVQKICASLRRACHQVPFRDYQRDM